MKARRPTVLLLGGSALSIVALLLTGGSGPATSPARPQPRDSSPPARVLAPVDATSASPSTSPTHTGSRRTTATPTPVPPPRARQAAERFVRAFAGVLYGRGDAETLPDASPAVREQANSAPDLAGPGRSPPPRLRGPWSDPNRLPTPGDVRLQAEVVDADQVLELDLELQPDPARRDGWTVVGLGW